MKLRSTWPMLVALLLATTIATTQPSSATAPDHGLQLLVRAVSTT